MKELNALNKKTPKIINRSTFFGPPTSCTLQPYVEPAVNRQPGFRRELVEQSLTFESSFLKFPSSGAIEIEESKASKFHGNFKIFNFFNFFIFLQNSILNVIPGKLEWKVGSTSPPGGNQVDGLPPASSTVAGSS